MDHKPVRRYDRLAAIAAIYTMIVVTIYGATLHYSNDAPWLSSLIQLVDVFAFAIGIALLVCYLRYGEKPRAVLQRIRNDE